MILGGVFCIKLYYRETFIKMLRKVESFLVSDALCILMRCIAPTLTANCGRNICHVYKRLTLRCQRSSGQSVTLTIVLNGIAVAG